MELWTLGVARLSWMGVAATALLAAGAASAAAQTANDSAGRAANDPFVTGVYHPENYARGSAPGTSSGSDNRSSITGVYHPDPPPAPPVDSARATKADSTAGNDERGTSAVVSLPVDLPVALACGDAPVGSSAADLLSVVFLQGATDAQRAAIVKQAGGVLVGRSAFGDDYVRVPESVGPTSLVADRLIRLPRVTQVEPVACPGAARAKAAVRAARAAAPCDSTAPSKSGAAAAKPSRQ